MHNDYPLAPEKLAVSDVMLSNFCSNFANEDGIKIGGVNKLVLNLGNISKYVKLHLSIGMKLVKFHKMIKFN